ncbi:MULTISPECIES: PTS sugar transporter subunit IIB [Citrobacter]|uniref:PTS sugar transporter subunit IIB n=1 Tax=Citrobacter TaxID=544 RepID=UPI000DF0EFB2|nr:PTS sugar transporter subunit IIB [Citrobacter braakii]MBJ9238986.1 PTS sugar transporter subunit IIB [Citrobacter braakii]WAD32705.1 PTS sugar transporter subunit IIB [Citrobacter braakii]STB58397.1 phosphotransferase enzyme II, B component [Citrobacter freundii]SUX74589.1 phosphotransferase enzyme II, B component [Citrobacter freundii]
MKGLIVCRTGMGSSLMLKIKAQKVIDKHGWEIDLEHDVLSGLRTWQNIDFVITMSDLTDEVEAAGFRAIGITDLMNSEEMESALTSVVQNN